MEHFRYMIIESLSSDLILERLKVAEFHITYYCDLFCLYCNRGCFCKESGIPDMNPVAVGNSLEEIESSGLNLKKLVIIGGEPTLNKDFWEILSLLRIYSNKYDAEIVLFSNGFSFFAQEILQKIRQDKLCSIFESTIKTAPVIHSIQDIFISPIDVAMPRKQYCGWHSLYGNCGFSIDSLGYTLCPIGGMISNIICPTEKSITFKELLIPKRAIEQTEALCTHCGVGMNYPQTESFKKNIIIYRDMMMSHTWVDAFKKREKI